MMKSRIKGKEIASLPGADQHHPRLLAFLVNKIHSRGPMRFVDFMEWVLYHPRYGYYGASKRQIDPRRDYVTNSDVHPGFGQLLAKQLFEMWLLTGQENGFEVVELGAGSGHLCQDILLYARDHYPNFFTALRYLVVERSPVARERQRLLLSNLGLAAERFSLYTASEWLADREKIRGCLLSNEFFDALPCHRVVRLEGKLREIYVQFDPQVGFYEVLEAPSEEGLERYFEKIGVELEEGREATVNLQAGFWLGHAASRLAKGFILTVDYGYLARDLYSPLLPGATLRCYHRQMVSSNPYRLIGYQDMTAHVDFTYLIRTGAEAGLSTTGLIRQDRFLLNLGILDHLPPRGDDPRQVENYIRQGLPLKTLLLPSGMGEAFNVLIQHKGMARQVRLRGLG